MTDSSLSTSKSVSNLQITSEQCDHKISNGLPTSDTFQINGDSYFIECLYGDNDLCQVYKQIIETININDVIFKYNISNNQSRRRMQDEDFLEYCGISFSCEIDGYSYDCKVTGKDADFPTNYLDIVDARSTIATWWGYQRAWVTLYQDYEVNFDGIESFTAPVEGLKWPYEGYCPREYECKPDNTGYKRCSIYCIVVVIAFIIFLM